MKLTPVDVSNVLSVAAKLICNICSSFDRDDANLYCTNSSIGQVCCQQTADDDNGEHSSVLVIHRSVEILTEYLRLLRNTCASCNDNQSAIQM